MRLAEVLSALTYALDLTDGQRPGHTLRTCVIAMRLGDSLGLEPRLRAALYYAALLKDSGCSSNAARMAELFGSDDHGVKLSMRMIDWHDRFRSHIQAAKSVGMGQSPWVYVKHLAKLMLSPDPTREIISARCERGAQIAHNLGFPPETSDAIQYVDEHWCGLGHPVGLSGEDIPLLSRILLVSQTIEAFWTESGLQAALDMVKKRRAKWFDPTLADIVKSWRKDAEWWGAIADIANIEKLVLALEPGDAPILATDERLDKIAYAFASVIDAKTPFTYRHSTNVAGYASVIATRLGYDRDVARDILRAGLLHDIGKLGISNLILDKPGPLTDIERNEMKKHPAWTWEILERVPAFHRFALPASLHHERLDGNGYPWGIPADGLDFGARILGIADVYEALTADRPYRGPMDPTAALAIMNKDTGRAFDPTMMEIATSLALDGTMARISDGTIDPLKRLTDEAALMTGPRIVRLSGSNIRVA
ncbi:MAG: HD domain-containing phosphohydrolase [Gemmatimonadaceae bacterium]